MIFWEWIEEVEDDDIRMIRVSEADESGNFCFSSSILSVCLPICLSSHEHVHTPNLPSLPLLSFSIFSPITFVRCFLFCASVFLFFIFYLFIYFPRWVLILCNAYTTPNVIIMQLMTSV